MAMLDSLEKVNLNAVFFQVRPECDALYQSAYEPWSRYLTGVQGTYPGYDPLAFAVEEAHKRGIELHVWLNPYRVNASRSDGGSYYHESHVYLENPEWVLEYTDAGREGKKILNPGLPEVQLYIADVVGDILENYDIDGVHFDDYFYDYGGTSENFDQETFQMYGGDYANVGDFRRGSINKMVEAVWDTIQSVKPFVRFGISPFGIYGNGQNPPGIVGLDAYNQIYCDAIAWLEEGTVDYINPQLYWPTGGSQDFGALLPWWAGHTETFGRHVFAGHGIYRLNNVPQTDAARVAADLTLHEDKSYFGSAFTTPVENGRIEADPWSLSQISTQVNIVRQNTASGALGSVYFRANDFERVKGLKQHLLENVYQHKSLPPAMTWKPADALESPTNIRYEQLEGETTYSFVWDHSQPNLRFAIYEVQCVSTARVENQEARLVGFAYEKHFDASAADFAEGSAVAIRAVDRYGNQSELSLDFTPPLPDAVTTVSPVQDEDLFPSDGAFTWSPSAFASSYIITIGTTSDLSGTNELFTSKDTFLLVTEMGTLQGETQYFWNVNAKNISGNGPTSAIRGFTTAFPALPSLTSIQEDDKGVSLTPDIAFSTTSVTDSLFIQISKGGSAFSLNNLVVDQLVNTAIQSVQLADELDEFTTHYIRIRAKNEYGLGDWTTPIKFKTLMEVPEAPTTLAPNNNSEYPFPSDLITFEWDPVTKATSYVVQIAFSPTFDPVVIEKEVFGTETYPYQNPVEGTHYFRVAGKNVGGVGDWSEEIMLSVGSLLTIDGQDDRSVILYPNPAQDYVVVGGKEISGEIAIDIVDIQGRIVTSKELHLSSQYLTMDVSQLSAGMYILHLRIADSILSKRMYIR